MSAVRVLVVEDDSGVRGLLETMLSAEGYDVTTASDGLGGLRKAASALPALILLDLRMPDLGGAHVLEQLQEDPALAGVPVIVLTGDLEAVPRVSALLGAGNVFRKPFAVGELLSRVGDLTGGPGAA